MDDWLATGISYGILLLIAENEASAEFGAALAWGLAAVVFVRNLPAVTAKWPGLFPGTGQGNKAGGTEGAPLHTGEPSGTAA